MGHGLKSFFVAVSLFFFASCGAHAQTVCNDASGFLKTKGQIPLGDALVLGPDCQHAMDGGAFSSQNTFNIRNAPYNAKCDYQLQVTGNLATASSNLTTSNAVFSTGDIGKTIVIKGAGAGGINLQTTIQVVNSAFSITLATTNQSGGPLTNTAFEFGHDDTGAVQGAIGSAVVAGGGNVYIPGGSTCWVTRLNLTNITFGVRIIGDGVNASRLMPLSDGSYGTAQGHAFDMTGSAQVLLQNFQFGAFNGLGCPTTGIFLAQVSANTSNRLRFYGIYFTGCYVVTTLYDYGVPSSDILSADFYNYNPGAGTQDTMKMSSTNAATSVGVLTSAFATVTSGTFSTSDFHFYDVEWHKFAGAGATGDVISLDNVSNISVHGGVISGGANDYVIFSNACNFISFINVTFETESQPVIPTIVFFLNSNATISGMDWNNSSYILGGGGVLIGGTGFFTDFKKGTFYAGNGGAGLAAGTTYFFGAGVLDTVSASNVFSLMLSPSVISNIFCSSSASPGQTPGYSLNVMVNGVVTGLGCQINGGNTTCTGNGYVNAPANSNINFRSVNAAATNTTRMACSTQIQAE